MSTPEPGSWGRLLLSDLTAPNTVDTGGLEVHGNLLFAGAMIVLGVLGARLAASASTSGADRDPARR